MDNNDNLSLFTEASLLEESAEIENVNLAGFQVTRAELFSHSREPSVTIWEDRIKFNMACLRRFPAVTHIQLLIHPEQKRIIIRPCDPDAADSLRWATKGSNAEDLKNREMICRIFAAKVFDLMGWEKKYRYKMLGKPAAANGEAIFLFKLTDFETFVSSGRKSKAYLPEDWRDYFGVPAEMHTDRQDINPAEGYISTDQIL